MSVMITNMPPSAVRIGALVPLTPPGWVDAGRHLLGAGHTRIAVAAQAGVY